MQTSNDPTSHVVVVSSRTIAFFPYANSSLRQFDGKHEGVPVQSSLAVHLPSKDHRIILYPKALICFLAIKNSNKASIPL